MGSAMCGHVSTACASSHAYTDGVSSHPACTLSRYNFTLPSLRMVTTRNRTGSDVVAVIYHTITLLSIQIDCFG
jgi:hypothetical protein